jgi:hypothetical protein
MAHNIQSRFNNFFVFLALLRRDIKVLRSQAVTTFFDGFVLTVINVFMFRYLFPLAGMQPALVMPVFLGSILMVLTSLGASLAMRIVFDLQYTRFIDYHLTLPIPKRWLFAKYVTHFALELLLATAPLLIFSLLVLRHEFALLEPHWPSFIALYVLGIIFFALFFFILGIRYSYHWFMANVWPRRIVPLIVLGAMFYPWYAVYHFSPIIGYIFLLNPFTYLAEGLRSSLLGGSLFLSVKTCALSLCVCIILGIIGIAHSIYKQLNPV